MDRLDQLGSEAWVERGVRSLATGWEALARSLGGRCARWDQLWLADAASPNPFLNTATLRRPLRAAEAAELTDRLEAFFAARRGGPWLLWSGWPTPELGQLGYVLWGHPPIMVRPPGGERPPAPPELKIVEVGEVGLLAEVERVLVEGYPLLGLEAGLPGSLLREPILGGPFRFWAGYVDERLVSVAAALVDGGLVHVMLVATRPDARRRGYGAALTWSATMAEPGLPALLEASDDGRPVYERMGYREVARLSLWERPRDMANPVY